MGSKTLAGTARRVEHYKHSKGYNFHVTIILENALKECISFQEFAEHHASSDSFRITNRCISVHPVISILMISSLLVPLFTFTAFQHRAFSAKLDPFDVKSFLLFLVAKNRQISSYCLM